MTKEELLLLSFDIIASSGEAKDYYVRAVKAAEKYDFEECYKLLKEGDNCIIKAHKSQTELLNAEVNGEGIPFSIILIHSQDHLMTTLSYEQSAKDTINVYKKIASIEKR